MRRTTLAALAVLALSAAGCATVPKQVYTPAELRQELATHPGIPPADVVVTYELPPEVLARARSLVWNTHGDADKVELLVKAMFDPQIFGLDHELTTTTTSGTEALRVGRGNCVALASIFIGLARAVGLDARFVDASSRVNETRYGDDGTTVNFGHVSALVDTGNDRISLDFARMGPMRWYRQLDDLEALAHYYNNRGFEALELSRHETGAPDWAEAARLFRLAVAVKPTFARGWNNLGIAAARLGRGDEALAHYRQAIALDPAMAAPHANLGAVLLQSGQLQAALKELDAAAALDHKGAHITYNLAVARLRAGDREGALQAVRRTIALRPDYPGAEGLLERLVPREVGR